MLMNRYQEEAGKTAIYPNRGEIDGLLYCTLGLAGEAGEVANKVKKIMRDNNFVITEDIKKAIKEELGGCLWYISQTCHELGVFMGDVADDNLKILADRFRRNAIKGSGDER